MVSHKLLFRPIPLLLFCPILVKSHGGGRWAVLDFGEEGRDPGRHRHRHRYRSHTRDRGRRTNGVQAERGQLSVYPGQDGCTRTDRLSLGMVDAYVSMPYNTTVQACSGGAGRRRDRDWGCAIVPRSVFQRPRYGKAGWSAGRPHCSSCPHRRSPGDSPSVTRSAKSLTECAISAQSSLYSHLDGEGCQGIPDPQPKRDGFT